MAGTKYPLLSLECVVDDELEALLRPGGALRPVVERALVSAGALDVQTHHVLDAESRVILRRGHDPILEVVQRGHTLNLDGDGWSETRSIDTAGDAAAAIDTYLEHEGIGPLDKETAVHALLSFDAASTHRTFQRDVEISFLTTPLRDQLVDPLRRRIYEAMDLARERADWWPTVREAEPPLDTEIDALALDATGRVLAIEARPATDAKGLAWAPAVARLHAEVVALWLDVDPDARRSLLELFDQRRRLGLPTPEWEPQPHAQLRVVPVVAIGPAGALDPAILSGYVSRVHKVNAALDAHPPHSARIDALEVWQLDERGERTVVAG